MQTIPSPDVPTPSTSHGARSSSRAPRFRLHGLDALRALAILGMVYMHVSPTGWLTPLPFAEKLGTFTTLESIFGGRAMSLFVLMAGISVALMTGGSRPADGPRLATARRKLAIRAGVLFVVSLLVDQFSGMNVSILVYYSLWMLLLIPVLRVGVRTLLWAAAVTGVALPIFCFVVLNFGRDWAISPFSAAGGMPPVGLPLLVQPQHWLAFLKGLLVGGGFQTPYAIPLLLAGLAIGRLDLRSNAVRVRLAVTGAALTVGAWLLSRLALGPLGAEQALAEMFSGDGPLVQPWTSILTLPPHQLYALSIPMAPFMLGIGLLLLTGLLTLLENSTWRKALWPLTASGRLALTWYALHLVFLEGVAGEPPYAFTLFAGMVVFALAFSPLWLRFVDRGPLEWLMNRATMLAAPRREVEVVATSTSDSQASP